MYACVGVGPAKSSLTSLTSAERKRLYFGTTTNALFKEGCSKTSLQTEEERGENFMDVHGMGQRDSKYWAFERKTAPLADRSACSFSRDFQLLPLGDHVFNAELAATYKAGAAQGVDGRLVPFKAKTAHSAQFEELTLEQLRRSRQPSCGEAMGLTKTLGGSGIFHERTSHEQDRYGLTDAKFARPSKVQLPKPNIPLIGRNLRKSADLNTTTYQVNHGATGILASRALLKSASDPCFTHKPAKPDTLKIRRAPHLAPGV